MMVTPTHLFVYRVAQVKDVLHAKCICCSSDSPVTWSKDDRYTGFILPDGPSIEISAIREPVMRGYPVGGGAVYEDEPFMASEFPAIRQKLIMMQNYEIVRLPTVVRLNRLPFFIGLESFGIPAEYRATVALQVQDIDRLPDVRLRIDRYRDFLDGGSADKYDRMMLSDVLGSERVAIPLGCYLPGAIESGGREVDAVYRLVRYESQRRADVILYVADRSVIPNDGCMLIRRARDRQTGRTLTERIGTVIDAVLL